MFNIKEAPWITEAAFPPRIALVSLTWLPLVLLGQRSSHSTNRRLHP